MAIKILALDLDGTLLTTTNTILSETEKTIKQASSQGIKIVLASGRPLSGIIKYAKQLGLTDDQYAVVFNGAVVQRLSGEIVINKQLNYQDFHNLHHFQTFSHVNLHFENTKNFVTLDRNLSVTMQKNAALTDNRMQVKDRKDIDKNFTFNKAGYTVDTDIEQMEIFWNRLPDWAFTSYNIVRSWNNIVEVGAIDASKGEALIELASRLGFEQNEVMIFGDQGNDISMFDNPNFKKVAMGNAIDSIKERADYVTDDNNHNGIAKALKKFVL